MSTNGAPHDIKTLVKILAPREVGITLVPLNQVEDVESAFFWASVFLAGISSILGSVISLYATSYSNMPVVYLLLAFVAVFLILFIAFAKSAFSCRKKARAHSLSKSSSPPVMTMPVSSKEYEKDIYIGLLYKGLHLLRENIFKKDDVVPEGELHENWSKMASAEADDESSKKLYGIFQAIGMVKRNLSDPSNPKVIFNSKFNPEKHESRMLGGN